MTESSGNQRNDEALGIDALRSAIDGVAASLPATGARPRVVDQLASSPALGWSERWRLVGAGALAMALVLAYPAYLGWVELPRSMDRASRDAFGPAELQLVTLANPNRIERGDEATAETLRVTRGKPLAVLVELDPAIAADGGLLELRSEAAPELRWRWPIEAQTLHRSLELYEGVPLVLPAQEMALGNYMLSFSSNAKAADSSERAEPHRQLLRIVAD
ncbi:MAG: hypothetical protein AAF560_02700 [Acidobacteriota bacterium]